MKRMLIYRLGSLGDTIVALPSIKVIEQAFPDHERWALTNAPVSGNAAPLGAILQPGGFIKGCIYYPLKIRNLGDLLRLRAEIRSYDFTDAVYLTPPRGRMKVLRDILFLKFCGIGKVLCAPTTTDLAENRIDPATGYEEMEAHRLLRTVRPLGTLDPDRLENWDLRLTETEMDAAARALAPLGESREPLAVSVGTKDSLKDWGQENWLSLMASISQKFPNRSLVLVGGPDDVARSQGIADVWQGPSVNLCGKLLPRETAALFDYCKAYIGHDSGPMHLATSRGTPCLAIFGNYNKPKKWFPYGSNHHVIYNADGIKNISVHEVLEAATVMLGDAPPA